MNLFIVYDSDCSSSERKKKYSQRASFSSTSFLVSNTAISLSDVRNATVTDWIPLKGSKDSKVLKNGP